MSDNNTVSIVVPVYRCEKYLAACIDSIKCQSHKNLEIILIDDGSPDNSGKICDEIALSDERIKVIHKENGGVSSARNCGIDNATGEYIMFVDSDDLIDAHICEHLVSVMKEDCELAVCRYNEHAGFTDRFVSDTKADAELVAEYKNKKEIFLCLVEARILNCPYAKLFKRSLIGDLRYDNSITLGEDLLFNLEYLKKISGSVRISEYIGYLYMVGNASSITNNFRESDFNTFAYLNEKTREFAEMYDMGDDVIYDIDRRFILDTLAYFQKLYFSDKPKKYIEKTAFDSFNNPTFFSRVQQKYKLGLFLDLQLYLMKRKRVGLLNMFFKTKKFVKKALNK